MENKALGKGLAALIPEADTLTKPDRIVYIPVEQIKPSKYQPREDFNQEKLNELSSSIKEKGVVQPVLVRHTESGYELIAGERRLRAIKTLGIKELPAIIRDVSDIEALQLSLIENIQREELNPIEEAHAYQRLITEFEFTQEKIAQAVGKDRASVANTLRLLKLPKKIQEYVSRGTITMGHAKAILALPTEKSQLKLCQRIITKGLSVREVENLIRPTVTRHYRKIAKAHKDHHILAIEEELQHILGTKVRITHGKKRGMIHIEYYSNTDLERILGILKKR